MNISISIHRNIDKLDIIERSMGQWHRYYAESAVKNGGYVVEILYNGSTAGLTVIYIIDLKNLPSIGVIYYIVVDPQHRGRGIGKKLIHRSEEYMISNHGAEVFMASTTYSNTASINLFRSCGYREYQLDDLYIQYGSKTLDNILKILCSYEDDILFIKSRSIDPGQLLSGLGRGFNRSIIRSWWYRACYKPWLEIRSSGI